MMHASRPAVSAWLVAPAWLKVRRLDRILFAVTIGSVVLLAAFWLLLAIGAEDDHPRLPIAESLLSGDDREGPMEEIDSGGRYQRYEGITVIMPVNTSLQPAVYQQAYDLIYTLYGGIISPLPVDSYHVTLTGIATRSKSASLADYNALISDNRARLEAAKWQLTNNARQQHTVTFTVEDAHLGSRGMSLTLRPSSDSDEAELRRLRALMERSLAQLYERQPRWHVGVGYRRLGVNIEAEEFAKLQASLMDIFRGVEVVVTPPVLCAFYDMRQLRPV